MSPLSPPQKVYPGKQHISNEPSRCTLSLLSPYSLHNRGPGLSVSNLLILPHTHVMQPPPSITNATPPKITELPGHARRRRRRCYSCRGRRRRRVGGDRARGRRGCRERGSGCTGAVAYVSLLPRSSSPAAATIALARRTRGRRGGRERGDQVRLYTSIVKHVAAEMDPCRRIYVPCLSPVFVLRSHLNTCIHLTVYIRIDAYRVHEFFYLYF